MGYNGLCLFGFGRWPAMGNYWKVRRLAENIRLETRRLAENIRLEIRKSLENIWFEIRKILDIDGIINFGDGHNITTFIHSLCYFCRFLQKCPNLHWRRRLLKYKILDFWKLCSQIFFWVKKLRLTFLARFIWTVYCLTLIYRIFRQNYFRWYREVCYKT